MFTIMYYNDLLVIYLAVYGGMEYICQKTTKLALQKRLRSAVRL